MRQPRVGNGKVELKIKRWTSVSVRAVSPCVDAKMLPDLLHRLVLGDIHVVHFISLVREGIVILPRAASGHFEEQSGQGQ